MPDAVLDKTFPNVINSAFGSSGQRCLAGSVVMPVGEAHEPVRLPAEAVAESKVGNGLDPSVTMGPVISMAVRVRILGASEQAVAEGAELLTGGKADEVPGHEEGYYVEPTLFDHVQRGTRLATQEIFGPVLSMIPVETLDHAIHLIGSSPYGSAASIFSEHGGWAREFQMRQDVGNVGINIMHRR